MQTILVTGANGFIGRHVVTALPAGLRLVTPRDNGLGQRVDLLDREARRALIAAERPDLVIHLAWVTDHGRFWHAPENADWEAASADLFAQAYAHGARRVVATGSCAEYDWTTGADIFAEDAPLAPHTPYGAAKVRTAARLADIAAQYDAEWAWGRVFFSFGMGEPAGRLVPLMLRAVLDGQPMDCGPAATLRDFWDVRCLGAAIAALALSDLTGSINLASGQPLSFGDLARRIQTLGATSALITPDRRALGPGEPQSLIAGTTRLREELGFRDPVSLDQGLADYLAALQRTRMP